MKKLGPVTIWLDCDVIQADGGTRTASITGSFIALSLAVRRLIKEHKISANPITNQVAAVSVGMVDGKAMLDLDYSEDSNADVDLNLVMNDEMKFIEIQGTSEKAPASKKMLDEMIKLGSAGIQRLFKLQNEAIEKK
jgi:ribonuclease PH